MCDTVGHNGSVQFLPSSMSAVRVAREADKHLGYARSEGGRPVPTASSLQSNYNGENARLYTVL